MLIKRKLSPSWWRGNVIKISSTNLADVIREIFPRGSEPPPPGSRFPWIFFFKLRPPPSCVFNIFPRRSLHVARRRLGRSAFRIETRIPWIVKGQRVFPRWNWGRICGARLIRDMFLTPARARTIAKTHTHTPAVYRARTQARTRTQTHAYTLARCTLQRRVTPRIPLPQLHCERPRKRTRRRPSNAISRYVGGPTIFRHQTRSRDLFMRILGKKCAKKVTRWYFRIESAPLFGVGFFPEREREKSCSTDAIPFCNSLILAAKYLIDWPTGRKRISLFVYLIFVYIISFGLI